MRIIYQTTITQIGDMAEEALLDNMLITFKQGAPKELAEYCFIHDHTQQASCEQLMVGDQLHIGEESFSVTAIGDIALLNLRELGHVTLYFDNAKHAELPGNIHLKGQTPQKIHVGTILKFIQV